MKKKYLIFWATEFASLTAISIILAKIDWSMYWIVIPVVLILTMKVLEYRFFLDQKQASIQSQLKLLVKLLRSEGVSSIRCTYHVPISDSKFLQVFDYIPNGGGGKRKFNTTRGIIAKAFQEKTPLVENFDGSHDFQKRMVTQYNYSTSELGHRTPDRRSYICYPVIDENHYVMGMIYCDSSVPHTFELDGGGNQKISKMIIDASEVIRDNMI